MSVSNMTFITAARIALIIFFLSYSYGATNANFICNGNHISQIFTLGDPKIDFDANAISTLKSGNLYKTNVKTNIKTDPTSDKNTNTLIIQDVNCPTDMIWDHLLNSNRYHKYEYYKQVNILAFTLNDEKRSDLDDMCGVWYVSPHPDMKNASRVYLSLQMYTLPRWIPGIVKESKKVEMMSKIMSNLKQVSEERYTEGRGNTRKVMKQQDRVEDTMQEEDKLVERLLSSLKEIKLNKVIRLITFQSIEESDSDMNETIFLSWFRIFLLFVISILSTYNVHLWLSR